MSLDDYPDHWHTTGSDGQPIDLRLSYVYDPADPADGVTVHVPLKALSRITPDQFTWNVPGLLDELILSMIKALPKQLRVQFVPAPDAARAIRDWIDEHYPDLPGRARSRSRICRRWMRMARPLAGPIWHMCSPRRPSPPRVRRFIPKCWGRELVERLSPYFESRSRWSSNCRRQDSWTPACARPHQGAGCAKILEALQRKFAAQAEASAVKW